MYFTVCETVSSQLLILLDMICWFLDLLVCMRNYFVISLTFFELSPCLLSQYLMRYCFYLVQVLRMQSHLPWGSSKDLCNICVVSLEVLFILKCIHLCASKVHYLNFRDFDMLVLACVEFTWHSQVAEHHCL